MKTLQTTIAGASVELLSDHAMLWPDERTLFVADLHLGKGNTFQKFGIPLQDETELELARLSHLVEHTRADRIVFLGDLLHSAPGTTPALADRLQQWVGAHSQKELIWIHGNHDRHVHLPEIPPVLQVVTGTRQVGPFLCSHEPTVDVRFHVLCGHIHPGYVLHDRNGTRLRCACFWLRPHQTVLPAFGRFTGTEPIRPKLDDRVCLVGDGLLKLLNVPG